MLFTSVDFLIFLPIFFILYWLLGKQLKLQNVLILVSSYIFYGWWDWRFLGLVFFSSMCDFILGNMMHDSDDPRRRKFILITSLCINLGILGFFKYFNFFIDSFGLMLSSVGMNANLWSLQVILPVGISFYTFQTLSYTLDIYKRKLEPTKDIVAFFAFVSFWPQLVAGPIERAKNLLPQFHVERVFDYENAKDGLRQMLWGFFKKVVVADQCAQIVNYSFENYETLPSGFLLIGVIFFAFQIYGDFSGYSDIAIGVSRIFGIRLMQNFAYPYFSRNVAEFWKRWHISLSTWFRDYVYIPLGGSRVSKFKRIRNIIITFTVSGFWHGANWTFVFWGFLNGLYYIPLMLANSNKTETEVIGEGRYFASLKEYGAMLVTFILICFTWVFFRAASISEAFAYLKHIWINNFALDMAGMLLERKILIYTGFFFIIVTCIVEWLNRTRQHGLSIEKLPVYLRWVIYFLVIYMVIGYWGAEQPFIYFQF